MAKKTEAVGMRFDEKTRYALELISRRRHRSYAGVITDLINRTASEELSPSFEELWSPDAPSRFLNLVEKAPALLDHADEMLLNGLILQGVIFQSVATDYSPDAEDAASRRRLVKTDKGYFLVDLWILSECWDLLPGLASGNLPITELDRIFIERIFGDDARPRTEQFDDFMERMKKRWEGLGS